MWMPLRMFKSGGYNVYPREIEILLESHPQVEMAAVVGVPDPLYQEVGVAYIIPRSDSNNEGNEALTVDTLKTFCKDKLAIYKVPKTFTFVDELPLLPVGKVDKVRLKKQALA